MVTWIGLAEGLEPTDADGAADSASVAEATAGLGTWLAVAGDGLADIGWQAAMVRARAGRRAGRGFFIGA